MGDKVDNKQPKINLSFREENKNIYDFLQKKKPGIVDYICDLVRKDIETGELKGSRELSEETKKYIEQYIDEQLNGLDINKLNGNKKKKSELDYIDDDVKNLILGEED